jgi:hypothetical protein
MDSNQKFKWALLVVDCMKQLRTEGFLFVDQEVVPNFNGTANEISAWFICEHYAARAGFDVEAATEALKDKLRNSGFPQSGVATLRTCVTSQTEIQTGGGRFYFFR